MAAKKLLIDDKITACVKQTCLLGVVVKQFAFLKTRLVSIFKFVLRVTSVRQQQVVTLRVCASRWTEVCGGIGAQRMQQRKMAPLLKITIVDHRLSHLFYLGGVQIRQSLFCNMRDWSQG